MISSFSAWHSNASMLLIASVILGMLLVAALAGWIVRRRVSPGRVDNEREIADAQLGYLIAAMLGNLALLLAFTFSVALDRYESRRRLAIEEANAIGTSYLRAQLLEEPHRTRISNILVAYTI